MTKLSGGTYLPLNCDFNIIVLGIQVLHCNLREYGMLRFEMKFHEVVYFETYSFLDSRILQRNVKNASGPWTSSHSFSRLIRLSRFRRFWERAYGQNGRFWGGKSQAWCAFRIVFRRIGGKIRKFWPRTGTNWGYFFRLGIVTRFYNFLCLWKRISRRNSLHFDPILNSPDYPLFQNVVRLKLRQWLHRQVRLWLHRQVRLCLVKVSLRAEEIFESWRASSSQNWRRKI